jgi:hypothetical protein
VQAVLDLMHKDTVDVLAPDSDATFAAIAKAIMAWWTLLFASGIFGRKRSKAVQTTIAGSTLVLGTIVKYAYALGVRRGQQQFAAGVLKEE